MDDRFYGYKHWTLEDVPRCFNVGIGLRRRPYQKSKKRRNHKWHAIVKRYGLRVEVCVGPISHKDTCVWEIEQIAVMETFSTNHSHDDLNDIGCNFTKGGEGALGNKPNITEKMRLGMSERRKGKTPWNKGIPHSEEQLLKMRGRPVSQETREKIGAANRGNVAWNKGQQTPEEVREKIRTARAKQVVKHSNETRKRMSEAAKQRYAKLRQPTYDHASEDASSTCTDSGNVPV